MAASDEPVPAPDERVPAPDEPVAFTDEAVAFIDEAVECHVEIVDFDDEDFAIVENESGPPPEREDAFQVFVRTLVEVSLAAGAPARVVESVPAMLGVARLDARALDEATLDALLAAGLLSRTESGGVARSESLAANAQAWRAMLLGEETELSVSTTLDEWSADLVATLAAVPDQREAVRRELRSRGIAAFGMIEAA